jgi:hypothetical protein
VGEVLSAMAEGLSVSAAVRVFGHGEFTIRTWLTRAGLHAASLHERLFQNLRLGHVQLDELCTKTRQGADALWVWFAVDARTTLRSHRRAESWATHSAGGACGRARSRERVSSRLPARFHQRCAEGVKLYFYALTAHFGKWAQAAGGKLATGKSTHSSSIAPFGHFGCRFSNKLEHVS